MSGTVQRTTATLAVMAEGAMTIQTTLDGLLGSIKNVQTASAAIAQIERKLNCWCSTSRSRLRAGDAGRSFVIIANAVKSLADQIHEFSAQTTSNMDHLSQALGALRTQAQDNSQAAQ